MIKLYHRGDCPFCWKARLAFAELGVPYEEIRTKLGEKHPDVVRLNPHGSVPVLVDGDLVIGESSIILEYLEEISGNNVLLPEDSALRARIRCVEHYSDAIIGKALREVIFEKRSKPRDEWDQDRIDGGTRSWRVCMAELEERLNGQAYFVEKFSFAECALIARFGLAEAYGVGVDDEFPGLLSWFQSMSARQSYLEAAPREFAGL